MADKYHISKTTGRPNKCVAKGKCPVGGKHFDDKETARSYVEEVLAKEHGTINPITKKPLSKTQLKKREARESDAELVKRVNAGFKKIVKDRENEVKKAKVAPLVERQTKFGFEAEVKREAGKVYLKNGFVGKSRTYNEEAYKDYGRVQELLSGTFERAMTAEELKEFEALIDKRWKMGTTKNVFLNLAASDNKSSSVFKKNTKAGAYVMMANVCNDVLNDWERGTTNAYADFLKENETLSEKLHPVQTKVKRAQKEVTPHTDSDVKPSEEDLILPAKRSKPKVSPANSDTVISYSKVIGGFKNTIGQIFKRNK